MDPAETQTDRRAFLGNGARMVGALALGTFGGFVVGRKGRGGESYWQIDP